MDLDAILGVLCFDGLEEGVEPCNRVSPSHTPHRSETAGDKDGRHVHAHSALPKSRMVQTK